MVPDAAWPGSDQWPWVDAPAAGPVGRLGRPSAPDPLVVGSFPSLGRPTRARVCGVLGHLAPVHRCARSVRCVACAVSWATWLLFTSVCLCKVHTGVGIALVHTSPHRTNTGPKRSKRAQGRSNSPHGTSRGKGPPLRKEKEFTSAIKTQPTLPVGPHAMQGRRVHGHGHYPMDLSHACKSVNQNSHYIYPPTWMVSPGMQERNEMIDTTVVPSPKST